MKKKKIENLERDIDDLRKKLEEEIMKQKMSSDKLSEELVLGGLFRNVKSVN
jgi:predicted RNase H-like nuclease (RuvC/YqgF family)